MIAPKTPLPWVQIAGLPGMIAREELSIIAIGRLYKPDDAAYAVHAANVLPEVVAALRDAREMIESDRQGMAEDAAIDERTALLQRIDAALAKADAP